MSKQRPIQFRIIAGELKGRRIEAPDLGVTRPPLSRLRKSIFDFLAPYLLGAHYLDLFSGTGSYLFEAVSRGVASAHGVELEPKLVEAINRQAQEFRIESRLICQCDDVFGAIGKLSRSYDIVLAAPPQHEGMIDRTLVQLNEARVTNSGAIIVCQHESNETEQIDFSPFTIWQQRKYGNTTFTVLKSD